MTIDCDPTLYTRSAAGPVVEDVGKVEEGAEEGPDYEADLHRHGEPGLVPVGQRPLHCQGRDHGGGGEPEGQPQELGQGKEEKDAPLARKSAV
mgnify:CR=1 FL=1